MENIYSYEEIMSIVDALDVKEIIKSIETGFGEYSKGNVIVPPVGEMIFENAPGESHIKYGYIKGDDYFVIKVSNGFYNNVDKGLPNNSGLMLVFSQITGMLSAALLENGILTNYRTAAAGAVAAKYLKPSKVHRIGIFGTGVQGRLQLKYLRELINCQRVVFWGVNQQELDTLANEMNQDGLQVDFTLDAEEVVSTSNLIITATPSQKPLVQSKWVQPGTHITAVGSDTPEKQELEENILAKADIIVADSIPQCLVRGEIYHGLQAKIIAKSDLVELGQIILGEVASRENDNQITVADLTGVAVQDIQISKLVYEKLKEKK